MYATRCTLWSQALASLSYLYLVLLSTYHIRFVLPPIPSPLPLFLTEIISRRRQATKDSDKLRLIGIFMYICAHVSVSVSAVIAVVIAVSTYSCSCSPSCVSTIASKLFKEMSSICLSFGLIRSLERGHEDEGDQHQIMLSL